MKNRLLALLLGVALLFTLAGCGRQRTGSAPAATPPETVQTRAPEAAEEGPALPAPPESVPLSFPLLASPFSEAESEEMINHNARRCALIVVNYYYCQCLYADGSRALVRYEIVDSYLRDRTRLVADCPADFLSERDGRLYYLAADGRPESVDADGADRRVELDAPCLSLQLRGGTLYCLGTDGLLLALRGGECEPLLAGCSWAFVSERGVFYTAASDGRAHLFDPAARTDVTLTSAAAESPTVIGTTLCYASVEADGRHLCALDLVSGAERRTGAAFPAAPEIIRAEDGAFCLRASLPGGGEQRVVSCAAAFDTPTGSWRTEEAPLRRCRYLEYPLRTDELFSPDGGALGFALMIPDGRSYPSLAADNPPEK